MDATIQQMPDRKLARLLSVCAQDARFTTVPLGISTVIIPARYYESGHARTAITLVLAPIYLHQAPGVLPGIQADNSFLSSRPGLGHPKTRHRCLCLTSADAKRAGTLVPHSGPEPQTWIMNALETSNSGSSAIVAAGAAGHWRSRALTKLPMPRYAGKSIISLWLR